MRFSNIEIRHQMGSVIKKIEKHEGVFTVLRAVQRAMPFAPNTVDAMLDMFRAAAQMDFMKLKMMHYPGKSVVDMDIDDNFWDFFTIARQTLHLPIGYDKQGFMKKLGKQIEWRFSTKKYTIEEIA
jgi:hypothetical protein